MRRKIWGTPHQRSTPRHGYASSKAPSTCKAPAAPARVDAGKQRHGDARRQPAAPDFKETPPLERVPRRFLRRPPTVTVTPYSPEPLGCLRDVHNELRRGLGPHEAVRLDCGAVALWARGLSTYFTAKIEPIVPSGAAVASPRPSLRSRGGRIDPVLPPENISCCVRTGSGLTDAPTATKCIEKSRRLRPVAGLCPSPGRQSWSGPVAGGLTIDEVQLALREKTKGETKNGKIAKRLARRRRHVEAVLAAERGRHHGSRIICGLLRGRAENSRHRFCG